MKRVLYFHNYTLTPATVTHIVHGEKNEVTMKLVHITEKGLYNPATGLLKVGFVYPTPWGNLPIIGFGDGYAIFN